MIFIFKGHLKHLPLLLWVIPVRRCSEGHTVWRPAKKSNGSLENKEASMVLYVMIGPRDLAIGNNV